MPRKIRYTQLHIAMFDFEFCAYGYRVYDIATFRWSRGSDNPKLWDASLNGYQSVRKLNESGMEAIEAFIQARNLCQKKNKGSVRKSNPKTS